MTMVLTNPVHRMSTDPNDRREEARKDRSRQRAERIRAKVPILRVLSDLGYDVDPSGGDREQQFPCDLHGTGQDNKPSARVYPSDDAPHWYCFACDENRDVIRTVMVKRNLEFSAACRALEQKFGLPPLPWADEGPEPPSIQSELADTFRPALGAQAGRAACQALLENATRDKDFPMDETMSFWEALDVVSWNLDEGKVSPATAASAYARLRQRVMDKYGEAR